MFKAGCTSGSRLVDLWMAKLLSFLGISLSVM